MISGYDKKYKDDFINLNRAWIEKMFRLEAEDIKSFELIDYKISNGANIYFNIENSKVIACAMIEPLSSDVYELSKVAAINQGSKKGASYPLIEECIKYAKSKNAKRIDIITNTMCEAAIHVYEKFGFVRVENEKLSKVFKRGNYFMSLYL